MSNTPVRVGLNGFGRIGRSVFRAALNDPGIEIVGINDVMDPEDMRYLIAYDSVYGRMDDVSLSEGDLVVGDDRFPIYSEQSPAELPWDDLDVDVAFECTGIFRTHDDASGHVEAGADTALLSAPPKGDKPVEQYIYGVNHEDYDGDSVVSTASCTTNSVVPPVYVLNEVFGVNSGLLTTVHAYTGSQNLIDGPKGKTRRGRAAAENIVPTSTGAAVAATEVLTELEGKLDGMAMRVPVPDGSITDLVVDLEGDPSAAEINDAFREYASGDLEGVLGVVDDPVVSRDIIGQSAASAVDLEKTATIADGAQAKVLAWYDNEFSYASQMIRFGQYIAGQ